MKNQGKNRKVPLTHPSEVKGRNKVFQKVKLKKTSKKHKKQITGVNLTRRLGEQLCTNCQMLQSQFKTRTKVNNRDKGKTNLNIHSEHLHEKCTNRVKLKCQGEMPHERLTKESIQPEHKLRVGNSANKDSDEQGLQQLFQIEIHLTKSSHKLKTNLLKVEYSRTTNRKIPFKMKRKVVRTKEINSKMKYWSK
jgi:hypothetical protein